MLELARQTAGSIAALIERALQWIFAGLAKWAGAIGASYFDWLY